LERLKAK